MAWLPETLPGFTPLVTFKHTLPLHRRVCNKRHFFQHQTYDQIRGIAEGPCQCHTVPQFIAERHDGHVVTADMQCSEVTRAMPRLRTSCGSPFRIMCRSFELRARLRVCACVFTHVILREASHYRMFMKCPKGCPLVILLVVLARASHRRAT
jgi:hypothetical protein